MNSTERNPAADPRDSRFRRQLCAEVLDGGSTVVLGGRAFRAAELLEATGKSFDEVFRGWVKNVWIPKQRAVVDACTADKTSRKRYESLRERVRSESIVAFVGSGASKPFGYPLWKAFLSGLLKWAEGIDEPTLDTVITQRGFEDAASRLCDCIHARHWNEQLLAEFGPPDTEGLGQIDAPVQWIPLLSPKMVVTTNYDPVLELIFERVGRAFQHVLVGADIGRFRDLRTKNKRCLLKIHGDRENPSTRVLTREEYDRAYAPLSDGRRELTLLFQNYSMLFVGCSLATDRTMDLLLEIARTDGGMPAHFALMSRPASDSEWLKRDRFLSDRGIEAIWYPQDHNVALEGLLGMLAIETGKVWSDHG